MGEPAYCKNVLAIGASENFVNGSVNTLLDDEREQVLQLLIAMHIERQTHDT